MKNDCILSENKNYLYSLNNPNIFLASRGEFKKTPLSKKIWRAIFFFISPVFLILLFTIAVGFIIGGFDFILANLFPIRSLWSMEVAYYFLEGVLGLILLFMGIFISNKTIRFFIN